MPSLSDLRAANVARQAEWCPEQVPDLSFRGNELAGEVGEACNVVKKLERERHGWAGSRATLEQLSDELADVIICADLVAMAAGVDLDAALVRKFNASSEKVGLATRLHTSPTQPQAGGQGTGRPHLDRLVTDAVARFVALSPAEQTAHRLAQAESWVRGEMGMDRKAAAPDAPGEQKPYPQCGWGPHLVNTSDATISHLTNEVERLREQLGQTRMCVNCGKAVDADKVKRGDDLPECVGPEGLSACTFDLTPREAADHWRNEAHKRREEVERLRAEVKRLEEEADGEFVRAAVRVMQDNPGFDHHDYQDGITADDFEAFFDEDLREAWRCYEKERLRAEAAEARVNALEEVLEQIPPPLDYDARLAVQEVLSQKKR